MEPVNVLRALHKRGGPQATPVPERSESCEDACHVIAARGAADRNDSARTTDAFPLAPDQEAVPGHKTHKAVPASLMVPAKVALEDDKEATIQAAPRMTAPERDVCATLLVSGDSSVGKSTFLRQLINSYKQGGTECKAAAHVGCSSGIQQFIDDPESLMSRLGPLKVPEERLSINLNMQDTPGVGDDVDYKTFLRVMVEHLLLQQETDYKLLGGNIQHLGPIMTGCLKHSVTALLYFLPPHRVKKLDVVMMAALSQLVPLIPVVGKADTMTPQEASKYREELVQALSDPTAFVGRQDDKIAPLMIRLFQFPEADLMNVGIAPSRDRQVFFVITTDTYQDGRPVRVYPYGVFDAANRQHSDFIVLKRLLMSDKNNGFWSLQSCALECYYSFCHQYEASGMRIDDMVDNICSVWGPYLDYHEYIQNKARDLAKSKTKLRLPGLGRSSKHKPPRSSISLDRARSVDPSQGWTPPGSVKDVAALRVSKDGALY